jgi:hypothetical protein
MLNYSTTRNDTQEENGKFYKKISIINALQKFSIKKCQTSAENIGRLLSRDNYFFVPFRQDNPITKPRSLVFDPKYIKKTLEYALDRKQIQPILL